MNHVFFICTLLIGAMLLPSQGVAEQLPKLRRGYGYLVIDTEVYRPVSEWKLSSRVSIEDIQQGHHIRFVALKAGNYHWQSINVPHFDLPFRRDFTDEERWAFTIEAGKINYIGRLLVKEQRGTDYVDVRMLNRSVMTYQQLQQSHGEALASYPFVYSGYLQDDFIDFLTSDVESEQ